MLINDQQRELVSRIDCSRCHIQFECDQIRSECPKANFQTLTVDDPSILKSEVGTNVKKCDAAPPAFIEITRQDFEKHLYGNITRCRNNNKVLSFFSGEKEVQGLCLFFFSHQGRYYRALRDVSITDAALEQQVMNFLYPDNKSFSYRGLLCVDVTDDGLFRLYPPNEREQPASFRISEMEVSTPAQAIEFINGY